METAVPLYINEEGYLVLILPMRNGNFALFVNPLMKLIVLILPMRNGNRERVVAKVHMYLVLILPMRNGNEI